MKVSNAYALIVLLNSKLIKDFFFVINGTSTNRTFISQSFMP